MNLKILRDQVLFLWLLALESAFVTSISLYPATLLPFHRSKNFETVNSHLLLFFGDGAVIVVVECAIILGNVILIFHLICKT